MEQRPAVIALFALITSLLISGCGYHLRSQPLTAELTKQLSEIHLISNHPNDPISSALEKQLHDDTGIQLSTSSEPVALTIHLLDESIYRHNVAVSSSTQVWQYLVKYSVHIQFFDSFDHDISPIIAVSAWRYYTNNHSTILGSGNELVQIKREMVHELSQKIIERTRAFVTNHET